MYHILLIVDFFPPHRGGIETVFENIVQRLTQANHRITVVTTRYDPSLPQKETQGKVTIHRTGSSRLSFLWYAYQKGKEILQTDPSIDIIHTSTYGGAIPAAWLAHRYHKKILITVHEIFGKLRYRYKGRIA